MMAPYKECRIDSDVSERRVVITEISCWQIFRLIFMLFSLYVVGEVFYRWEGFTYYYASFSELIPTIALVIIFFSIVAMFASMLIWISGRTVGWFFLHIGWKLKVEHWLLFVGIFILLGYMVWTVKLYIVHHGTTLKEKLSVFLCVSLIALFLTWMWRNKVEMWMGIIQKRITPFVWLFGVLVVLSVLVVAYHIL